MKTIITTGKILLLAVFIAATPALFAQTKDGEKTATEQYHLNIVRNIDGNEEVIDRTFTSKEEMNAFVKENQLELPGQPEKNTSPKAEKQGNWKKDKTILIEEKEGNADENAQLTISFSNFTPAERATLIQQMLEMKGCKVEMRKTKEITSYNSAETTQATPPVTTGVNSATAVTNLQLYPNPNKGQFHISFNTDKPLDVKLRIMDMNGKEVYNDVVKSSNGLFNKDIYIRPAVSEGTYILEAESNGQKITTQVVVQ